MTQISSVPSSGVPFQKGSVGFTFNRIITKGGNNGYKEEIGVFYNFLNKRININIRKDAVKNKIKNSNLKDKNFVSYRDIMKIGKDKYIVFYYSINRSENDFELKLRDDMFLLKHNLKDKKNNLDWDFLYVKKKEEKISFVFRRKPFRGGSTIEKIDSERKKIEFLSPSKFSSKAFIQDVVGSTQFNCDD